MKEIVLNKRDVVALVDDEDFERISRYKWCLWSSKKRTQRYAIRHEAGKTIWMHRFIMNAPRGREVDHRNGNGLDNRRDNLRLCTHAENLHNSGLGRANTSGYKGVTKSNRVFQAKITIGEVHYNLGTFRTARQAARAYDAAADIMHGEFATRNLPGIPIDFSLLTCHRRPCRSPRADHHIYYHAHSNTWLFGIKTRQDQFCRHYKRKADAIKARDAWFAGGPKPKARSSGPKARISTIPID